MFQLSPSPLIKINKYIYLVSYLFITSSISLLSLFSPLTYFFVESKTRVTQQLDLQSVSLLYLCYPFTLPRRVFREKKKGNLKKKHFLPISTDYYFFLFTLLSNISRVLCSLSLFFFLHISHKQIHHIHSLFFFYFDPEGYRLYELKAQRCPLLFTFFSCVCACCYCRCPPLITIYHYYYYQ